MAMFEGKEAMRQPFGEGRVGRRRALSLGAVGTLFPAVVSAQVSKVHRICLLETIPADQNAANLKALRQGLRERGYVEGSNLEIDYRSADGQADRFPALAKELAARCDLIVTRGTPAARAAKEATSTIPIVMAAIGEPLGVGVVKSLAQPGGNVTGFSAYVTELAGKRIEWLKRALPTLRRVGFMLNMGNPVSPAQWEATRQVADALGLSSELIDVRTETEISQGFANLAGKQIDGLSLGIDALTQAYMETIVRLAAAHRIVTAYPAREFVDAGGLLSYGPSYPDLYRRTAGVIDKIFKGTRAGDIPIEQPIKIELVINLNTAKALGLTLPPSILAAADETLD
jgi:putative ABC transport system substrate-binding protein